MRPLMIGSLAVMLSTAAMAQNDPELKSTTMLVDATATAVVTDLAPALHCAPVTDDGEDLARVWLDVDALRESLPEINRGEYDDLPAQPTIYLNGASSCADISSYLQTLGDGAVSLPVHRTVREELRIGDPSVPYFQSCYSGLRERLEVSVDGHVLVSELAWAKRAHRSENRPAQCTAPDAQAGFAQTITEELYVNSYGLDHYFSCAGPVLQLKNVSIVDAHGNGNWENYENASVAASFASAGACQQWLTALATGTNPVLQVTLQLSEHVGVRPDRASEPSMRYQQKRVTTTVAGVTLTGDVYFTIEQAPAASPH